jgi:isoquinoline 1-oxidoreductase subunit alpha
MSKVTLHVNGQERTVDAAPDTPLLWALRDGLGLLGPKFGCGMAMCGACTVHLEGQAVRSCVLPVSAVGAAKIVTIEGLATGDQLTALQKAWCDLDVPQCGYCQAGQLMSASSLLASNPHPSDKDIDEAMAGNLCRCGTYARIREAIHAAAGQPAA